MNNQEISLVSQEGDNPFGIEEGLRQDTPNFMKSDFMLRDTRSQTEYDFIEIPNSPPLNSNCQKPLNSTTYTQQQKDTYSIKERYLNMDHNRQFYEDYDENSQYDFYFNSQERQYYQLGKDQEASTEYSSNQLRRPQDVQIQYSTKSSNESEENYQSDPSTTMSQEKIEGAIHNKEYTQEDLDNEIENIVNKDNKVSTLENQLDSLKRLNLSKKELQIQRNRLTAQLSRDRKKIETDYLRSEFVRMRNQIQYLTQEQKQSQYCQNCSIQFNQKTINKEIQSTRVKNKRSKKLNNKKSSLSDTGSTTKSNSTSPRSAFEKSSGFQVLGKKRSWKSMALGAISIALVTLVCLASYQNQTEQTNYRLSLPDDNIQVSKGRVLYEQPSNNNYQLSNEIVPYKEQMSDNYYHNFEECPISQQQQLNQQIIIDLRDEFINRQLQRINSPTISTIRQDEKDSKYKITSMKNVKPYYLNPSILNEGQDDFIDWEIEEIQHLNGQQQNKKFLNLDSQNGIVPYTQRDIIASQTSSLFCSYPHIINPKNINLQYSQNRLDDEEYKEGGSLPIIHFVYPASAFENYTTDSNDDTYVEIAAQVFEINQIKLSQDSVAPTAQA